jgi:hypothetical protein
MLYFLKQIIDNHLDNFLKINSKKLHKLDWILKFLIQIENLFKNQKLSNLNHLTCLVIHFI